MDNNSDQRYSVVNRYVFNRDLNELVDLVERSLFHIQGVDICHARILVEWRLSLDGRCRR